MFTLVRGKLVDQWVSRFWVTRTITIRVERAYYGRVKTNPASIDFRPEF